MSSLHSIRYFDSTERRDPDPSTCCAGLLDAQAEDCRQHGDGDEVAAYPGCCGAKGQAVSQPHGCIIRSKSQASRIAWDSTLHVRQPRLFKAHEDLGESTQDLKDHIRQTHRLYPVGAF